jgi:hypothetical protein
MPTKQRKAREFVYHARHINGKTITGTFAEVFPDKTLSRLDALEQVNKWNRLACAKGEPCLWTYWIE